MDMETPASSSSEPPAADGDDRLSGLPDHLLANNILSRLTSLQAARTSSLSRRWRHLWRAVPCVDIDQREFRASESIDVCAAATDILRARNEKVLLSLEESEAFEDLADRLLPPLAATDAAPLDALRLRISCLDFRSVGRRVARRGLARRPVEFHLTCDNDGVPYAGLNDKFPHFPGHTLPRHLGAFACRLRTMHLAGLSLHGNFADCLAKDFLVLEDLQLEGCDYGFQRLASQSLRKLCIDRCRRDYMANDVLAIASPRIASLRINCRQPPITVVGEMPDLVVASLRDPAGELGVLRSLRHARSLDLTGFSMTALLGGLDFPVFSNLRNLVLDGCDVGVGCQVLRRFLENAPSLETLTLRDCAFSSGSSRSNRKRKARSGEMASDDDGCRRTAAYECKKLRSINIEFCEGNAVGELAHALADISKEMVHPIESSVQDGKRRVRISFT
ncbi:unnamed protein product [Urochloa humidicola]